LGIDPRLDAARLESRRQTTAGLPRPAAAVGSWFPLPSAGCCSAHATWVCPYRCRVTAARTA